MTDEELIIILEQKTESADDIIVKAYHLGRYFGAYEFTQYIAPERYDRLCDFISERTALLITELRHLWGESLQGALCPSSTSECVI